MDDFGKKMFLTDIPEDIKKLSRKKLYIRIGILISVYALETLVAVIFWEMFF